MADGVGVNVEAMTHWAIPVNDLEESREFYTQILNMEDGGAVGDRMHCVRFAGMQLLLCRLAEPTDPNAPRRDSVHLAFQVSPADFDRAQGHMADWGVTIQRPSGPPDTIRGNVEYREDGVFVGRSLYFNDPSGNRLELHDPKHRAG
jgi:catechol 2,3-dioxygenase-like lactoylglutathione lyase family enzyme